MFTILTKELLAPLIKRITVFAPDIAQRGAPGQFVVLRINERGERVPLTIAGQDTAQGTITLIFQEIGKTTRSLGELNTGDSILDMVGPLGHPTHIEQFGTVAVVGGGVGVAELLPVARALKNAGNKALSAHARKNSLFWKTKCA